MTGQGIVEPPPTAMTCPVTWSVGIAAAAVAADLLAWTARLAPPTHAAAYEPKRLRVRILAVAGRIVTTARRWLLKIDVTRPWADTITTAHTRLCALPGP